MRAPSRQPLPDRVSRELEGKSLPSRSSAKRSEGWLGGRDSNPDTVVQSHVSYRWTTSQYRSGVRVGQELSIICGRKRGRQADRTGTGRLLSGIVEHRSLRAGVARVFVARVAAARLVALLLLLAAMARHPAFAARLPRFLTRPLVRGALLMRGLATLAGNLALLAPIHRCK